MKTGLHRNGIKVHHIFHQWVKPHMHTERKDAYRKKRKAFFFFFKCNLWIQTVGTCPFYLGYTNNLYEWHITDPVHLMYLWNSAHMLWDLCQHMEIPTREVLEKIQEPDAKHLWESAKDRQKRREIISTACGSC